MDKCYVSLNRRCNDGTTHVLVYYKFFFLNTDNDDQTVHIAHFHTVRTCYKFNTFTEYRQHNCRQFVSILLIQLGISLTKHNKLRMNCLQFKENCTVHVQGVLNHTRNTP